MSKQDSKNLMTKFEESTQELTVLQGKGKKHISNERAKEVALFVVESGSRYFSTSA